MAAIFQPTKTAVITGGASGIGLALARKCVGHGMRVLVADRDTAALAAAAESIAADAKGSAGAGGSGSVRTHDMDVARLDDWGRLKDVVVKEFGGQINLLALNAGVGSRASFNDAEPDAAELRRVLDTNVFGVLNGITTLLPVIKQHQQQQESSNTATTKSSPGEAEAAIVITGSKQGITNPPGSSPAYNASKAAVKTLAEQLEHSLRDFPGDGKKRGIAVHLLVPGWTWTPLAGQGWLAKEKPPGAWTPGQVVDYLEARMREGQFWVLCPDNDVDEETDRKRMLWTAGDAVNGRPPLSRWRDEYKDEFEAFMKKDL